MIRLIATAWAAAAFFACSQTPPLRRDGGAGLAGRSCNVDAECGDLKCDLIRHQCVCQSDADCEGQFCNNFTGLCTDTVNGCQSDQSCTSSEFCDPQTRTCRLRRGLCEACLSDAECGGDLDNCIEDPGLQQKFCGKACTSNAECPRGTTCQLQGGSQQCWPETGKNCKTFTGCTPDSLKPCTPTDGGTGDEQCKDVPGQVCDPARGQCVAQVQSCPFGMVCDPASRICVPSCSVDQDCTQGQRCTNRYCEPVGQCQKDADCPLNKVCNSTTQQCVPFCTATGSCPLGEICTLTADNRSKCVPGCTANVDCPPDAICVKQAGQTIGSCQTGHCQFNDVCATCETCELVTYTCQSAKPVGYCKPCSTDTECATGGYCLQMTDGKFCGKPCPQTGCPKGFGCRFVTITGGSTVTQCVPADVACTSGGGNKCGF